MAITQTAATALATGGTSTLVLKIRPDATSVTFYCSSAGAGAYLYADYTMDAAQTNWLPMTVQDNLGANLTQPAGLTGNSLTTYTATLPVGTQYVRLTAQTAIASTWLILAGSGAIVRDTALGVQKVALSRLEPPAADLFNRLRVCTPTTIFDSTTQYDARTTGVKQWEHVATGTGTATVDQNKACVTLSTGGTASGAAMTRQSHVYHRYQPGKTQLIYMTQVLGAGLANVNREVMYGDDSDGLGFKLVGTTLNVVQRSSVSGSVVDTVVAQSSWNYDRFDGTGPSGVKLDLTKANIFAICFQWLGVGVSVFGIDVGGIFWPCHVFNNPNANTTVYMKTPHLPVRWKIVNTGVAASTQTMDAICATVISEGGVEGSRGTPFSADNGFTPITVGTAGYIPLLVLQPKATFAGVVNRGQCQIDDFQIESAGSIHVQILWNATLTGAVFNSVDANSLMNFDVAASAATGGTRLWSGYVNGTSATTRGVLTDAINSALALVNDFAGTTPDTLSIVARSLAGNQATQAVVRWVEYR